MEHVIAKLLQGFEDGKMTRRQLIQSLTLAATAASAASAAVAAADSNIVKATYLNHVGYRVADYPKSLDWYADLFGMKKVFDNGKKACLAIGESLLNFHPRPSADTPVIDHICFTIANWDQDKNVRDEIGAELKRRGLEPWSTPGSLNIKDPDGLRVQIGGKDQ